MFGHISFDPAFLSALFSIVIIDLILRIAVKLFAEGAPEDGHERKATTIRQAIKNIVIADITLPADNMLPGGCASRAEHPVMV